MEQLSNMEELIFIIITSKGKEGIATPELITEISKQMHYSYARTTVVTYVDRISQKGYAYRIRVGRVSYIFPLIDKNTYLQAKLQLCCKTLFRGDLSVMLKYMKTHFDDIQNQKLFLSLEE